MEEEDTNWERAHLRVKGMSGEMRYQLGESAIHRVRGVGERDTDWERAHLRVEGNEWRRETPTERERT